MPYLTHRFSNLSSLAMLLVLSVGTAWLFSFAMRVNSDAAAILEESATVSELMSERPETAHTTARVAL